MELFLKDKGVQATRILLLLMAGYVLMVGIQGEAGLSIVLVLLPYPIWVAFAFYVVLLAFVVMVVVYAMRLSE